MNRWSSTLVPSSPRRTASPAFSMPSRTSLSAADIIWEMPIPRVQRTAVGKEPLSRSASSVLRPGVSNNFIWNFSTESGVAE